MIRGSIEVPAQGFYRFLVGFVLIVSILLLGTSAYDLIFGSHHLLTRSRSEIGPGHPAAMAEHFSVFMLVPLVATPIVILLWPKARSATSEVRQTYATFLETLFKGRELAAGANRGLSFRRNLWFMKFPFRLRGRLLDPPGVAFS